MDGDFFFVLGIILVIAAVAMAFVGIRGSAPFPPSRGLMVAGIGLFIALVGATMAFAIVKSEDEQSERNEELAKEEEQAHQAEGATTTAGGQQAAIPTETLNVSSPADGGLIFEPNGLEAKPGNLTITYDNPSPVGHSLAVATNNDNVLAETSISTNSKESVQLTDLNPGKYVFYCTVPGHREAGMQGDLTVLGGQS
jgi:plastocyanin